MRATLRVVDAGGAIVFEHLRDTPPIPWAFRAHGRIVAGLAECLFVCEAGLPSGPFAAADAALEAGKPVLAVPGRIDEPTSAGPNMLVSAGAYVRKVGNPCRYLVGDVEVSPRFACGDSRWAPCKLRRARENLTYEY